MHFTLPTRGGIFRLLASRLAADLTEFRPHRRFSLQVSKRACHQQFAHRITSIQKNFFQSDMHVQRWTARLAQGSEYVLRALNVCLRWNNCL
jgi:hypothetical protein